jgi:hypothetical protein
MLSALLLAAAAVASADPSAPQFTLATCDDPVARHQLLLTDPEKLPALDALKARSTQNETRMTQLMDRLAERAKLTPEQKAEVGMKMLDSPDFKAAFEEGMTLVGQIMADMNAVAESKDELKNCRTIVHMMSLVPAVDANANRQWEAMRRVVEAEAVRLGVSLAN